MKIRIHKNLTHVYIINLWILWILVRDFTLPKMPWEWLNDTQILVNCTQKKINGTQKKINDTQK